jgi:pimeloyl-ACP methyl ester carboxylesterase
MTAPSPVHVVFVHGFLSSAKTWSPFRELIAADPELSAFVTVHCFEYESPVTRFFRVDRRIAELDDIADLLSTYLAELREAESIVLITHSQGGLVVQRFLARTLWDGRGKDLAKITRIAMYACPNTGSQFFLSLRKLLFFFAPNPQERQLRPLDKVIIETQRTVFRAVINAQGRGDTECHIPIEMFAGANDNIVPPKAATFVFPMGRVIDGDHFTIIKPENANASQFRVLKSALLAAGARDGLVVPGGEAGSGGEQDGSVVPPFSRRKDDPLQGREDLIASIMSDERSRVHVLAGLGGSGKSRLALEIAYRAQRSGRRVWWVVVPRINACMREVASQLNAPENEVERAWRAGGATDLAWRLLDAHPKRWLLIFDNADDPQRLGPPDGPVSDGTGWLREPLSGNGAVIVTSRYENEDTWGSWSTVHHVPPLGDDDGAAMLMNRVGSPLGGTYEQARLLSHELGGLPLALRAAADYLKSVVNTRVYSGPAVVRDFDGYRLAVKRRFESPAGASGGDLSATLGLEIVQRVFEMSLRLLADRGLPQAAPLLKMFACLNITPIPYHVLLNNDALAECALFTEFTPAKRHAVLDGLADLGLVEPRVTGAPGNDLSHVLTMHPLVHGMLREDPDVLHRRTEYYGLVVRMLLAATKATAPEFPEDFPENWGIWNLVAPHAIEVCRAALLDATPLADRRVVASTLELTRHTARYLIATGLLGPAHDLVWPIVDNCDSFGFNADDREILALRHEQGRILLERGDPVGAEAQLREVIAGRERVLGSGHFDTLASGHKLAKAILEQGRFEEAEPLLKAIVEAEKTARGEDHDDTIVVRHSLARAILALGRAAEAETMARNILTVCHRKWSANTPETLFLRQTLARALFAQGKATEAEDEVRDALRAADDRTTDLVVMRLRFTLATILMWQDRVEEAVYELTTLLEDREKVLGAGHPETANTRTLLEESRATLEHPT